MRNINSPADLAAAAGQKKKEKAYWLDKLSGEPEKSFFPSDTARTAAEKENHEIKHLTFGFPGEVAQGLITLSNQSDNRLHVILAAGLALLLKKYTGNSDILFGTPIYRQQHHTQLMNRVLILRNQVHPQMSFKELLMDVGKTLLEAVENQNYPFEILLQQVDMPMSADECPLLDIGILLENIHDNTYLEPLKLNMIFAFKRTGNSLEGRMEYNSCLYTGAAVERIAGHYINCFRDVLFNIDISLKDINILSPEEKRDLLDAFGNEGAGYPGDKTLHRLFSEQVERTPDCTALVGTGHCGGGESPVRDRMALTYKELNRRSDQLAHRLREKGVRPDTIAAIMMDRFVEMIVGLLGILKAGGAYLPIDPDYPGDRINYFLQDSDAEILLHKSDEVSTVSEWIEIIDVGNRFSRPGDSEPSARRPQPAVHAGNLAYVIYTSGTTGRPKGVMIEHRNVVRLFFNDGSLFDFNSADVWTMFHSYNFDFSVWEMYGALLYGGTLVIIPKMTAKEPALYLKVLKKEGVTVVNQTPSAFYNLLNEELNCSAAELIVRYVIFGGEALSAGKLKEWKLRYPGTKLVNMFGITETTVHVTYKELSMADIHANGSNIGKPIPTLNSCIMDRDLKLLPVNATGELFVGGAGVARGYLNRQELTGEKFIENPFQAGARLYRSGDLVRISRGRDIEYCGRIDHQVQLRGFRIELGEIESRLLTHREIKDAVVIDREGKNGDKYLCAFIVSDKDIKLGELREYLAKDLPDHMIPSYFYQLDRIPLTKNEKVDKKALLTHQDKMKSDAEYEAPRTGIEEKLVDVWEEVLAVEGVGINDNFFELGGDSIKALQVSNRMLKFKLKVEVEDLFLNQTVRQLGKAVKPLGRVIHQGPVTGDVPLTPIQQWFFENHLNNPHHFNQAVMVYRKGGFHEVFIKRSLEGIVRHHDALRMIYRLNGNGISQENRGEEGIFYDLEIIKLDIDGRAEIEKTVEQEAGRIQQSINLEKGPLVKTALFKTAEGDYLLLVIHHLVVDGVSWRILLEDFALGYRRAERGEAVQFQDKTDSFKHWSERLREYAGGRHVLKELSYWEKIGESAAAPLSPDFQAPLTAEERKNKNSDVLYLALDESRTKMLMQEVNRAYNTTVNDILLTALAVAVKQWAGIEKLLVNLEGHGREPIIRGMEISRTVGWFTAQFPVLLDVSSGKDLSSAVQSVKETLRAVPGKGTGYGILKYLTPEDKKGGARLQLEPSVSFNYLGEFGPGTIEDALFQPANLKVGDTVSPDLPRKYLLDINGMTMEGKLNLAFSFNRKEYKRSTVEKLIRCYESNLIAIIEHCVKKGGVDHDGDLSIEELDNLKEFVDLNIDV